MLYLGYRDYMLKQIRKIPNCSFILLLPSKVHHSVCIGTLCHGNLIKATNVSNIYIEKVLVAIS